MKRYLIYAILFILCLFIVGCGNSSDNKNVVLKNNPYEVYKNINFVNTLNKSKNINDFYKNINGAIFYHTIVDMPKVNQFVNKREEMLSKIDINAKGKIVKLDYNFFSKDQYVYTNNGGQYIYIGKMKDNKPDGIGMIKKVGPAIEIVYQGNFKDGRYDGYGLLYKNGIILAEGEFVDGAFTGNGNIYGKYDLAKKKDSDYQGDIIISGTEHLMVTSGIFKDMKTNGKVVVYQGKSIIYDGESYDNEYDGDGTLYNIKTGKILYKGHFSNDKYDGEGTLYNDDGSVKYSGKWDNGDYAH